MPECPACGAPVDSDAHDCERCGRGLEGATESFEPVSAQEGAPAPDVTDIEGPALIVRKGHEIGERFYVQGDEMSIGRDPESDLFLNDVTVSRAHAVVRRTGDLVTVEDAGSLNGTYVNGVCIDKATLTSGDTLQVGTFQMVFLHGKDE